MKFLISMILMLGALAVHAGNDGRGGGDPCEERIKVIRDDISEWIIKGGHQGLTLPNGVSKDSYSSNMLTQINLAKITCVGINDVGYPVEINGTPKVCRFDLKRLESRITCDKEKFKSLNESEQYTLIHHEYAGLSQIEVPSEDDSDYKISNQISSYLVDTIVKKLAIKTSPPIFTEPPPGWRRLDMIEGLQSANALQDILSRAQYIDCTFEVESEDKRLESNCPGESKVIFKYYRFHGDEKNQLATRPVAFDCGGKSVVGKYSHYSMWASVTHTLLQNKDNPTKFKQITSNVIPPYDANVKEQMIIDMALDPTLTKISSVTLSYQERRPIPGGKLGAPVYANNWSTKQTLSCHARD